MSASLSEPQTKLTQWFKSNSKYPGANYLRYDEPRPSTWNRKDMVCKPQAKFRRREPEEVGHHLQAPLFLQSIILKSLERPS